MEYSQIQFTKAPEVLRGMDFGGIEQIRSRSRGVTPKRACLTTAANASIRNVIERGKNAWSATGRGLRRVFWHKWVLIAAIAVLVALGGVAAAAYGYDRSQSDIVAKGVHVGGIPIGGMSAAQARAKLNAKFKVLTRPIILTYTWRPSSS